MVRRGSSAEAEVGVGSDGQTRWRPSRRGVLSGLLAVPGALALTAAGRGLRAVAVGVRPPSRGTSARACGQCGSADHTMLDGTCPSGPRLPLARALRRSV